MLLKPKHFLYLFLLQFACSPETISPDKESKLLFQTMAAEQSGIDFTNAVTQDVTFNILDYDYMFNGGGVATGDVNNDGLLDLFFTGNQVPNKLYLNKGELQFKDVSIAAGINLKEGEKPYWHTGVTMADVNADGWLDIYVCRSGMAKKHAVPNNEMWMNNGDGTFSEVAQEIGINDAAHSTQATFLDYDKDGDLDLFVLNHFAYFNRRMSLNQVESYLKENPEVLEANSSHLFENKGGKFVDVTVEKNMQRYGYGLGVVAADLNGDNWTDLFVSYDYSQPNVVWINDQKGGFKDETKERLKHGAYFSMGCDVNDFNNDGLPDLIAVDMAAKDHVLSKTFMTSMRPEEFAYLTELKNQLPQFMFNELQLNRGGGEFSEIAQLAGIAKTDWSWAPLFADFDNDGKKDLYITNGFKQNSLDNDFRNALQARKQELKGQSIPELERLEWLSKIPSYYSENQLLQNKGNLAFESTQTSWIAPEKTLSNGAAYADLDNDGDLDLVINNIDAKSQIIENLGTENGFVQFQFKGTENMAAYLNTKIFLYTSEGVQFQEVTCTRGFQSAVNAALHFGLADETSIDSLKIIWPNGSVSRRNDVAINTRVILDFFEGDEKRKTSKMGQQKWLDETNERGVYFSHKNRRFNDFSTQVLLPHKISTLGPYISVGDANNDGLEDFYVGGNVNQSGELFIQNKQGSFTSSWTSERAYEDMGSVFFDANGDGFQDLYVVSGGGGEMEGYGHLLHDRLYLNNGTGGFTRTDRIPEIASSGQEVVAIDYDQDGDMDLVVGGRVVPGKYPTSPESFILENREGNFINVTSTVAPELQYAGMISAILVHDFTGDGVGDLIITGEWMSPMFLELNNGRFTNVSENYLAEKQIGWWLSLEQYDVDGDGKDEIVVGNIGGNNKFHPSKEKPLSIYYGDFDDNGREEMVLGTQYEGKNVPVRGRECSSQQLPYIEKKFTTYNAYATAGIEEILGEEKVSDAKKIEATEFRHMFIKDAEMQQLDAYTQIGPLRSMAVVQVGNVKELLGVGNLVDTEVETAAYDGNKGFSLIQNKVFGPQETGLLTDKDARDIQQIKLADGKTGLLVSNFGGPMQLYVLQ